MRTGDRLICAFVDSFDDDDQFTSWPLHVVIVPWFRVAADSDELAGELLEKLSGLKPFHVVMGDETKLGHDKTVNLVGCPTHFTEVEEQVRQSLKSRSAWIVDETTKRQREYQPHVTAQKDARLYRGDTFICDALYVVEQHGDHKQVVAKIELDH